MSFLRADQAHIVVRVSGVHYPSGVWQSLDGGDIQTQSLNFRPGGMMLGFSFGGPTTRSDATVKRLYDAGMHGFIVDLEDACGSARMNISYTPLDADGNSNGIPTVNMTGSLKQVLHPPFDAEAARAAVLTLVMDCDVIATLT